MGLPEPGTNCINLAFFTVTDMGSTTGAATTHYNSVSITDIEMAKSDGVLVNLDEAEIINETLAGSNLISCSVDGNSFTCDTISQSR
jgi:hypothetical protein